MWTSQVWPDVSILYLKLHMQSMGQTQPPPAWKIPKSWPSPWPRQSCSCWGIIWPFGPPICKIPAATWQIQPWTLKEDKKVMKDQYIYIYIYVCAFICKYTCVYMYIIYIHIYIYTHIHTCVCNMITYAYICTCTCIQVIYVIYICMFLYCSPKCWENSICLPLRE